jgi:hypothetical protein
LAKSRPRRLLDGFLDQFWLIFDHGDARLRSLDACLRSSGLAFLSFEALSPFKALQNHFGTDFEAILGLKMVQVVLQQKS